jgi:hypothetical protein
MSAKKTILAEQKTPVISAKQSSQRPGKLKMLGGSASDDWNHELTNQTLKTLWLEHCDDASSDRKFAAAISALTGIGPRDELEGMMAAQLIAAHNAAMECYRRAMLSNQPLEGYRETLNQANKLSRTFTLLLEALNRHRGKGQQKVTVEHVHVHACGQAVVGIVEAPGGGDQAKSKDQPHAKVIADAREPSMRSPHKEGEQVQITSDAERSLPDARRNVTRRT